MSMTLRDTWWVGLNTVWNWGAHGSVRRCHRASCRSTGDWRSQWRPPDSRGCLQGCRWDCRRRYSDRLAYDRTSQTWWRSRQRDWDSEDWTFPTGNTLDESLTQYTHCDHNVFLSQQADKFRQSLNQNAFTLHSDILPTSHRLRFKHYILRYH